MLRKISFDNTDDFLREFLIESFTKRLPFEEYDVIQLGNNEEIDISERNHYAIYNLLRLVGQKYYEGDKYKDRLYVLFVKYFLYSMYVGYYDNVNDVNEKMKKVDVLTSFIIPARNKGKNFDFIDEDGNRHKNVFYFPYLIENPDLANSYYEENSTTPLIKLLINDNGKITDKYHEIYNDSPEFFYNLGNPYVFFIAFGNKNAISGPLLKLAEKISSLGILSELIKKYLTLIYELDSDTIDIYIEWLKKPTHPETIRDFYSVYVQMYNTFLNHPDMIKAISIFQYLATLPSDKLYDDPVVQRILIRSLNTDFILTVNVLKSKRTFDELHKELTYSYSMLFADIERTIVPNLDALELIVAKRLEKSLSAGVIDKIKKILKAVKDNIKLTRRIRITIRYKKWEIIIEF
ncbi:MAG: hypothetical protein KatS3mg101_0807 [Patescibacteria group bacterium]|nr:MAG: hypothetical protein KatS3mg101_0807 [Patescibacteria group bacterium]